MGRHKVIQGRLLNLDKKFSDLSRKQQEFIKLVIRQKYEQFSNLNLNRKEFNHWVLNAVQEEVEKRGIWLPYPELKKAYYSYKSRLHTKNQTP